MDLDHRRELPGSVGFTTGLVDVEDGLLILRWDHGPDLVGIEHAVVLHGVHEVVTREPPPALALTLFFYVSVHPDAGLVLN
jgi:hypothetical protein